MEYGKVFERKSNTVLDSSLVADRHVNLCKNHALEVISLRLIIRVCHSSNSESYLEFTFSEQFIS